MAKNQKPQRGRPPLPKEQVRSCDVRCKATPAQYEALKKKANGTPISAYIHRLLFGDGAQPRRSP